MYYKIFEIIKMFASLLWSFVKTGARRGGGAAIAVRMKKFSISKLNIPLPRAVEVVWGLLKPKVVTGKISTIIVCCFYSPPNSKKNRVLIDHLTVTLQSLLSKHPNAGVIISGDRNSIDISSLLSIDPSLRQTVREVTRGQKILDVIVTNLARYFNEPVIIPPIMPDRAGHGVPSDHSGVSATPNTRQGPPANRNIIKKVIRPLPESLLQSFEIKLAEQNFDVLRNLSVENMVAKYQDITNSILSETFPEKTIIVSAEDVPWYNEKLRQIKRQRLREYDKHGRSEKYLEIAANFERIFKCERSKYFEKIQLEVTEGKRGSIYPTLKRLAKRPGETAHGGFQLPEHAGLSSAQSAEIIAEHFSSISQEYSPLDVSSLPPNVQDFLSNCDQSLAPKLSIREVEARIVKAKKPNGTVPGDLPKKLVQACPSTIAVPATIIFNKITEEAEYPKVWKIEHQIALPKVPGPETLDELRNIAKTPFLSKTYESFVGGWLLPIIQPYLDPGQCGLKGSSITHYLIKLLHFVHAALDLRKPHAVLAACVDLSKAFNRVDHSLVIQDLYDMHTPSWLLKIMISYLSDRSMYLSYNGAKSSLKAVPAGGPQGAYLGGIVFIIKYNGAFLRPPVPRHIQGPVTKSKSEKVKYIDDGTVAVTVNLKASLISDPVDRPMPRNYHERTGHVLPVENNLLQYYVRDAEEFVSENRMIINKQKTKVISFTKSRILDFPPELTFSDGSQIESVPSMKLLGVVISPDMKWFKNTSYICEKARGKLWILRRMLKFELDIFQLFDAYTKEIRSILEMAVPVWHSGLTKIQISDIESIQKVAMRIILQDDYVNYELACKIFSTETLEQRGTRLCLKFARKNLKSDNSFFTRVVTHVETRHKSNIVSEFKCNFGRFKKSSLPYMARLLNSANRKPL